MQHRRAVAVEHALRIAGGAGGIAEGRGGVLVEDRPFVLGRGGGDEFLVDEEILDLDLRRAGAVAERHPAQHMRQARRKLLDERREDGIEEHVGVLGVMDDILQLFGEQARVDRVQHPPRRGDAIVELKVTMGVPGERRDPVAGLEAERVERAGDLFRPHRNFGVGRAMDRAVGVARDDLASPVLTGRVVDQCRNQKRTLLHQSKHGFPPRGFRPVAMAWDHSARCATVNGCPPTPEASLSD